MSSGGEEEDYIKCELIGGGSPRHLNTISNLYIVAVHFTYNNTCYVLLLCMAAIVDCTHVGSATAPLRGLSNISVGVFSCAVLLSPRKGAVADTTRVQSTIATRYGMFGLVYW